MAISLSDISRGKAARVPRIFLLGVDGVGKSTFAQGDGEGHVFIPVRDERGLDEISAPKFPPVKSFAELMDALKLLATDDHGYTGVVIDSVSALQPLVWRAVCDSRGVQTIEQVDGGFGKGYVAADELWRELVAALDWLRDKKGMRIILIGHVIVKQFNDPLADPYDQYREDLHERAANILRRWADCVLFANFKAFTKNAKLGGDKTTVHATAQTEHVAGNATAKRFLFTEKRPGHPGKNRYGLPYELALSWPAFTSALATSQPFAIAPDAESSN